MSTHRADPAFQSTGAQNRRAYLTSVFVSIFVLLTILSIISSYFFLDAIDSQERVIHRSIERLVAAIERSESRVTEEAINAHRDVIVALRTASSFYRVKANLPPPAYSGADDLADYRAVTSALSAQITINRAMIHRWNRSINVVMLVLSLAGILTQQIVFGINRKMSTVFLSEVQRGIDSIHDLLQFKEVKATYREATRFPELSRLFAQFERVADLIDLDHSMAKYAGYGSMPIVVERLSSTIKRFMPCERVALAFITSNSMVTAETMHADYPDIHLAPGYSERLDATSLKRVMETGSPRIVNDLPAYATGRVVSNATKLLVQEGVRASITAPLIFRDKCVGFLFVCTRGPIDYEESDARELYRIASAIGHTLYMEYLFQETISESAQAFVSLVSEKDNETSLHLKRMAHYSYLIAREYNLSVSRLDPAVMREILWFSPLHDIGKIGIPDSILHKPGPLSAQERNEMKDHVTIGERVIGSMDHRLSDILSRSILKTAIDIISGHHEKFDGSGYPRGTAGLEIPIAGRIVAAADVFDALTSKRPYKEAWSVDRALRIMKEEMTGHFDPDVLASLERARVDIEKVYDQYKEV